MLNIKGIDCYYNSIKALNSVTLKVEEGDLVGIIGPNGSGKTTLLRCVSGVLKPKIGVVLIDNYEVNSLSRREIARHIAVVPQESNTGFNFKVLDVMLMGRNPHIERFRSESKRDLEVVYKTMKLTGIQHLADRFITNISGGERRKVIIARALAQEPEVLLLDEPTTHLDVNHQMEIMELVKKLCLDKKLTILIVFHDFNLAARYCNKLTMLSKGRIVSQGRPEEVITEKNIQKVFNVQVTVEKHPLTNSLYVVPIHVVNA